MIEINFAQTATDMISKLGYSGLAAGLVLDSAGVPIPSEVLLPLAGALARQGRFDLAWVIFIGITAQVLGGLLAYLIGRAGGVAFVERYGKYMLFSERELHITERWFERYGVWLAGVGRCLPVIRSYIGYPAGVAKMDPILFTVATIIGSSIWTVFLVWVGYALGEHIAAIDAVLHKFTLLIIALLGIGLFWYIRRHLKKS